MELFLWNFQHVHFMNMSSKVPNSFELVKSSLFSYKNEYKCVLNEFCLIQIRCLVKNSANIEIDCQSETA